MRRLSPLAPILLAACASAPGDGVDLLVPDDVEFAWNAAYDEAGDGRVALLPLDVMVYDAVDGEPVEGATLELWAEGVGFVGADTVEAAEPWCSECPWDAYRDEYVAVDLATATDHLEPATDATGLARVHVVVDAIGVADGLSPIEVQVRLGAEQHVVRLVPR